MLIFYLYMLNLELPRIYNTSPEVKAVEGTEQMLKCIVSGIPAPKVEWRRNRGEMLDGRWSHSSFNQDLLKSNITINLDNNGLPMVTHTVHIQNVNISDAGRYICVATNRAGELRENIQLAVLGLIF